MGAEARLHQGSGGLPGPVPGKELSDIPTEQPWPSTASVGLGIDGLHPWPKPSDNSPPSMCLETLPRVSAKTPDE